MFVRVAAVFCLLSFVVATSVIAAGGGGSDDSGKPKKLPAGYEEGVAAAEAGDFAKALETFERLARQRPRDPDVLNMLAYSQRKTGDVDRAIGNYKKALNIRPKFPQAREYLGEAYLQAALRELETLKGYGDEADAERAKLVQALQAAVWDLPPAEPPAKTGW
jgi:Flp pilus assembly protein TadD